MKPWVAGGVVFLVLRGGFFVTENSKTVNEHAHGRRKRDVDS